MRRWQFRETERLTALAQQAVLDGKQLEAIVLLGDIRARAVYGVSLTVQAYHGNYQEGGDVAGPTKAEARLPPG